MEKIIMISVVFFLVVFFCGNGFSYAPIIGNIPDVYISDVEDNVGQTIDLNFFRFSDAFNFDEYISIHPEDEMFQIADFRWSFMADSEGLLLINKKETLSDPSEAYNPQDIGKELTGYPNDVEVPEGGREKSFASFRDLVDSPEGSGPPWPDPVPGNDLNEIITIYASNGTYVDSTQILVVAQQEVPDYVGPFPIPTPTPLYDSPATQGWTKSMSAMTDGSFLNAVDGAFYIAQHLTDGGSVGIAGDATENTYGSWQSPDNDIEYIEGQLYLFQFRISTNQPDQDKVPNTRIIAEAIGDGILAASGAGRIGKGIFAPSQSGEDYRIYFAPPANLPAGVTNIRLKFELIDFDLNEEGTNYLDEVEIARTDLPSPDDATLIGIWTPPFLDWSSLVLSDPFGTSTPGSDPTGIYIETPASVTSDAINYGSWTLGAANSGISFESDRLYRCVYTLQSPDQNTLGKIRLINQNQGGDWSTIYSLVSDQVRDQMPDADGEEYNVFFETMPVLYYGDEENKNNMSFSFDVSDGKETQEGRAYLTRVELYMYDLP